MRLAGLCAAAVLVAVPPLVAAQEGTSPAAPPGAERAALPSHGAVNVELNKLEPVASACRAYFLVENQMPVPLQEMRLDVFLFDLSGVVLRRVALSFADVGVDKIKVALFDLPDLACTDVSRLLVNDVIGCTIRNNENVPDCGDLLSVGSKASAEFRY
ncbi:Tat pathway signal protein [Faunimonas sp. B44]|uniref:Tat pathway signal protein n=1 Tax=Faunimonas sp. B44 TaxID=3461493 RepID=UPI00404508A2